MAAHRLIVVLVLALLLSLGGAGARRALAAVGASGVVDSERPLGEVSTVGEILTLKYFAADDGAAAAAELGSGEEFEACDLGSHAGMYSDGLSAGALGGEGRLRFVSSKEDCEGGLRLRVRVLPQPEPAEAPAPSSSASSVASGLAWAGVALLLSCLGPFMVWWRR